MTCLLITRRANAFVSDERREREPFCDLYRLQHYSPRLLTTSLVAGDRLYVGRIQHFFAAATDELVTWPLTVNADPERYSRVTISCSTVKA